MISPNASMRAWALGLLCLWGLAAPVGAGTNVWTRAGTGLESVVNTVAFHPARPGSLYAGAVNGLFFSGDGGRSWQIRGAALVDRNVLSLAPAPGDPQRLYAGANTGLFFSADAGATWQRGQGLDAGVLAVAAGTGGRVYAGTFGRGVFASADSGRTWSPAGALLESDMVFSLTVHPLEARTAYAGTGRGLFVSRDAGANWAPLGLAGESVRSLYLPSAPQEAGLVVAGTFGGGVWVSANDGRTWEARNSGLGDRAVRDLEVDPRNGQVMYAATATGGFFRTKDQGRTWAAINEGSPGLATRSVAVLADDGRVLGSGPAAGVWEIRFAAEPQIRLLSTLLDFGKVGVGVPAAQTLRIANSGTAELVLTGLSTERGSPFSVETGPIPLAPGDTARVQVRFQPAARGEVRSALTVRSNDPDEGRLEVALRGTGVQAQLLATPGRIHFGEVRVGAFKDTTVVLSNTGNAELSLRNAFFEDTSFRVLSFQPQNLRPGESLALRVRFVPLAARGLSGRLVVVRESPNPSLEVPVDGVGTAPDLSLSSASMDFGTVDLGRPQSLRLGLSNSGNAALNISAIEVEGEAFSSAATAPLALAPGASREVELLFLPLVSGTHTGLLRLVSDAPGRQGQVEVSLRGAGGALALRPQEPLAAGQGPVDLLVVDLDLDGDPDLAVADSAGGRLQVMLNDGTGQFPASTTYPGPSSVYASWDAPMALAAAPLLGALPDLIVADPVSRTISILANDGAARFDHSRQDLFIGHRVADVVAVDLDADGDIDIAVTNYDAASITLLFNNGQGSFNARATRPAEAGPVALAATNLNADGHRDLVVANQLAGTVSLFFNDRSGGFLPRRDVVVGLEPVALALVDYDADGDNDALVASRGSRDVAILANDGAGNLQLLRRVRIDLPLADLALSDLTADVFSDLVVASPQGTPLGFWENEAGKRFAARDILSSATPARKVAIADLSGDGANDIAVLSTLPAQVQLFVNEDTRRLDPPRPPTGVLARDVARDLGRRVEIAWQAPELDEQIGRTTEYVVYKASVRQGPFAAIDTVVAGNRKLIDIAATLADTFYYYVRAGNAALHSPPSDTVSAASRPAPFFELQVVDEARFSVGDTLRVRAFLTPAEHRIAGLSLFMTYADSALSLIDADSAAGVQPFRLEAGLVNATVLENRLHPRSSTRLNLSLAQLDVAAGVEPVLLGEIWFRTSKDTVTFITIDDEAQNNRRSSVVEAQTGEWILPFIPEQPTRIAIRDFPVLGRVQLEGRDAPNLRAQISLFLIDSLGDTLRSPLNDEDRLRPGVQSTLDEEGNFRLAQVPRGVYRVLVKAPTHLQGRVLSDTASVGSALRTALDFSWVASDSTVRPALPAGDANDDNRINLADFGVFVRHFGATAVLQSAWSAAQRADFNGDGTVNIDDFFLLAQNFGEVGMGASAAAGKAAATGWVRVEDGQVRGGELGALTGFSLLLPEGEDFTWSTEGTLWEGRSLQVRQWQEGAQVRLAGALLDPEQAVQGEGVLLQVEGAGPLEVEVLGSDGAVRRFFARPADRMPAQPALLQNFPNPFNPSTTIPFVVGGFAGEVVPVRLDIFNALGQRLRTLVDEERGAGWYQVEWDGRDQEGREVATGLYLYRLQAGAFAQTRALLLLR